MKPSEPLHMILDFLRMIPLKGSEDAFQLKPLLYEDEGPSDGLRLFLPFVVLFC